MKKLLLLPLLFIATLASTQEKFQKLIDRNFGTSNTISDFGYDVKQTYDNGYILLTQSDNYGIGGKDIVVTKLNEVGDTLWSNLYGSSADETGISLSITPDSGYVITGETKANGAEDAFLLKLSETGNIQWNTFFDSGEKDFAYHASPVGNNGYILSGKVKETGGNWDDGLIIRTDNNGDTLWTKRFGIDDDEVLKDVIPTTDGGFITVGTEDMFENGIWLTKLNANGDTTWNKTYRGNYSSYEANSIKQTPDGGFIIAGNSYEGTIGGNDMVLLKTNGNGIIEWANAYGTTDADIGNNIIITNSGDFLLTGTSANANSYQVMTAVKVLSDGSMDWVKQFNNQYGSYGYQDRYKATATSDNGFAFIGELNNNFGNELEELYKGYDAYLVKMDSLGNSFGCESSPSNFSSAPLTWTSYNAPIPVFSGLNVSTGSFSKIQSETVSMHAGVKVNMVTTNVTCGASCNGSIKADPCHSSGFYCSGQDPYTFTWNDPSSQTTDSIINLCTGTYTVTVSDYNGCKGIDSATIITAAPNQSICIVTVDSTSSRNIIIWEKPSNGGIQSFNVYRDIAGNYALVGNVPYDSLSQFVDTTNGINPNITSYRYKIETIDTCGNTSPLSDFHETMHLQTNIGTNGAINLVWDAYEGVPFMFYRVWRDSTAQGDWELIDSVSFNNFTYTDLTPPQTNNVDYFVEVIPTFGTCTSTKAASWNSSRSNRPPPIANLPQVEAAFSASTTTISEGQTVNFNDMSTANPTTWEWTFQNGTPATSTAQNPSIVYNSAGTFDVTLVAHGSTSSDTLIKTGYITVIQNNGQSPSAEFIASSTTINMGESINFTDLSTNFPTSWSWVFSNGSPSSSTDQNPQNIVYSSPGVYDVSLSVLNTNGNAVEVKTAYITILDTLTPPVANFECSDTSIMEGQSINFTDLSTNTPTTWLWSFEGANTNSSTDQNPSNVQYTTAGVYSVTLTATNAAGSNTSIQSNFVTVTAPVNNNPTAAFLSDLTQVEEGNTVQFTDNSTNTPTSWLWTFENGTPATSTAQNPSISYFAAGTYNVTLVVANSFGSDTITSSDYITVTQPTGSAPVSDFFGNNTTINVGDSVTFTDISTNVPTTWSWNFSNGTPNISSEQNPTITYNTAGVFDVVLTVSNGFGNNVKLKQGYITVVQNSTGISEYEERSLAIFPNPTSGEITIKNNGNDNVLIEIYNSIGQQVEQFVITSNNSRKLTLAKGIYILNNATNGHNSFEKIIVH